MDFLLCILTLAAWFPPSGTWSPWRDFGREVCALDDMDGDRRPEIAYGVTATDRDVGAVVVYSTKGARRLWTRYGVDGEEQFGRQLATASDIDKDGAADLAVGAPLKTGGSVTVLSGRNGQVLMRMGAPEHAVEFGRTLSFSRSGERMWLAVSASFPPTLGSKDLEPSIIVYDLNGLEEEFRTGGEDSCPGTKVCSLRYIDDFNGDGARDLLVANTCGHVFVLSGSDGSQLFSVDCGDHGFVREAAAGRIGSETRVFVGVPRSPLHDDEGVVLVYSQKGELIHHFEVKRHAYKFGSSLDVVGTQLVVAAPSGWTAGVYLFTTDTLKQTNYIEGQATIPPMATQVRWVSDFDGDGKPDLLFGRHVWGAMGGGQGAAYHGSRDWKEALAIGWSRHRQYGLADKRRRR